MSKDNYNIDNILSEVKKRREENEKEIKEKFSNAEEEKTDAPAEESIEVSSIEHPEQPVVDDDDDDFVLAEDIPADEANNAEEESFVEPPAPEEEVPIADEKVDDEEEPAEEDGKKAEKDKKDKKDKKPLTKEEKKKKRKKTLIGIIIALLVLIIGAVAFGAIYFNDLINELLDNSKGQQVVTVEEDPWNGMDGDEENFVPIYETEATELSSLQDMMKMWYYNGSPASKSKVLNVLLVGEDTRGSEILDDGTRADAAIICSINAETKEITLTSILRDAYAYFESTPTDGTTGQFGKINGAMSIGDIGAYINCVENLYKIDIDNYVIVNFDSFETIVDTLGGVTLDITEAEINEINNHRARYNKTHIDKNFEGSHGKMKLTGKQALAYCRIRKLDSDNMRADRQKTCLIQLFKQSKKASKAQMLKVAKKLIPYVKTGFKKQEILKIVKYAITEDWLSFGTDMTSVPEANLKGGIYYGAWCWKCDFPQDAYNLQMKIYGKSNITLAHLRVDTARCPETGYYSEGASRVWQTITNEHYGEVTTLPAPETDDAETTTSN